MSWNLGFILRDGRPINHRSLLKVLLNPLLRTFGWQVASIVDVEKLRFEGYRLIKCPRRRLEWTINYPLGQGEIVVKKLGDNYAETD